MVQWKDVVGFEGIYQVSDKGEVRSVDRIITVSNGKIRKYKSKILKQGKHREGYRYVNLSVDSRPKKYFVHRLVAIAFLKNPESKDFVNHIDGNKSNNELRNLEWVTYRENITHAGLKRLYNQKLTFDEVKKMRSLYKTGNYTHEDLSNKYGVSPSYTGRIINKKYYKYI